jgi:hypothetical protein
MSPTAFGRVPGTITNRAAECVCVCVRACQAMDTRRDWWRQKLTAHCPEIETEETATEMTSGYIFHIAMFTARAG